MYPQVFGKYVLERELARGGMARVLLATLRGASGFEKKLVVKQIRDELAFDEDFVRRFVEEAKTTVALSHPNIVPVYELGVEFGTYFLAMEYVEGRSATEVLREAPDRKLTPNQGAHIGAEVCRALDYAHRRMNVVHRDVTPRNVMIDEEGHIRVIDFGIATRASVEGYQAFGSPGHMPPEQIQGGEVTPATDVFAVAVLLMELWSGAAPFRRKDSFEIETLLKGPHPKPSEIDPRLAPLDEVISASMSLDPKQRPQAADDLGRALRKFLSGADTGDIARELGDLVRKARARARALEKSGAAAAGLQRPPSRGSGEIRTKTFAARDELRDWSPAQEPTTRVMAEPVPVAEPVEAETSATRPIETDAGATPVHVEPKGPRLRSIALVIASVLAVSAYGARTFFAGSSSSRSNLTPATQAAASGAASVLTPSSVNPTLAKVPPVEPSAAVAPSAPASVDVAPRASASAAAPARARLRLYGDPGTLVSIDGSSPAPCPRDAPIEAGSHDVRFTFSPTGESRAERIVLRSGQTATMRADFTGASPSIRVQR